MLADPCQMSGNGQETGKDSIPPDDPGKNVVPIFRRRTAFCAGHIPPDRKKSVLCPHKRALCPQEGAEDGNSCGAARQGAPQGGRGAAGKGSSAGSRTQRTANPGFGPTRKFSAWGILVFYGGRRHHPALFCPKSGAKCVDVGQGGNKVVDKVGEKDAGFVFPDRKQRQDSTFGSGVERNVPPGRNRPCGPISWPRSVWR